MKFIELPLKAGGTITLNADHIVSLEWIGELLVTKVRTADNTERQVAQTPREILQQACAPQYINYGMSRDPANDCAKPAACVYPNCACNPRQAGMVLFGIDTSADAER